MTRKRKSLTTFSLRSVLPLSALLFLLISGCSQKAPVGQYHPFPGQTWERFDILSFSVPVTEPGTYDVTLSAGLTPAFEHEVLAFNMVMNTPSGEERIREYEMTVRKPDGSFAIPCKGDSCSGRVVLKRGMRVQKPGMMKIAIENLTPRVKTPGIRGVGITLERSGE